MKIALTGASGFVGRQIVPHLAAAGAELLLVGRDPARLAGFFPGIATAGYDDLATAAKGFDLLVHMAVVNNAEPAPEEAFFAVNVDLLMAVAAQAQAAGVRRLVNLSSIHALDPARQSAYARSKREAARRFAGLSGIEAITVYLPAVHGERWAGRLAPLNRLPGPAARALFTALAAFRPTLGADRLAAFLIDAARHGAESGTVLSDGQAQNRVFAVVKRLGDLLFALAVIGLFWWGLALIWVIVRAGSRGPGLFAQERIGRGGRTFTCYKFRTMRPGTVQAGTHEVSAASVTRVGRVLRASKLDELPQVWNILKNDISLIGPRPCLPVQRDLIEARRRRGVLAVKPGISGLAQVNGVDMSDPEKLARWDARYVALQSLALDLKIAVATFTGRGQGDRIRR